MTLPLLTVAYFVIGIVLAVCAYRRARPDAWISALVTIPLWPVWAPFALARDAFDARASIAR